MVQATPKLEDGEVEKNSFGENKVSLEGCSDDSLEEKESPPVSKLTNASDSAVTPPKGQLTPLINPETGRIIIVSATTNILPLSLSRTIIKRRATIHKHRDKKKKKKH